VADHGGPGTVTDVELERVMQEGIQQQSWTSSHCVTVEGLQGIIRRLEGKDEEEDRTHDEAQSRKVSPPGSCGRAAVARRDAVARERH
jgi:hypothetical protein